MTDLRDLAVSVMQAHEWGYRDPAEGMFIEDRTPFDLANAVLAQGMSARQGENSRSEVEGEARQPGQAKPDAPALCPHPNE